MSIRKLQDKKDLRSTVLDLASLVEYQGQAVVSRELIKQDTGTLSVFAFDKGEGLSEHTAPFDATVYILDGQAQITIAGKAYTVEKGQMIIMPAHKPHSLKVVSRFKMLLVLIRGK